MRRIDLVSLIAIVLMIASLLIGLQYYYNIQRDKCLANPLLYSAEWLENRYGYPFVGSGYFVGTNINSPIVTFDKSTMGLSPKN